MSDADWVDIESGGDWQDVDDTAIVNADKALKVSMLESGARGLAQGATLGFADEIAGGAEALFTDKPYAQARDESRANFKRAEDVNPNTYLAGELGGGLATAVVPGLSAARGIKGAMGLGAAVGGISGLGASEADNASDMALDFGKGAGVGAVGGGALKAIPAMGRGMKGVIDDVATAPLQRPASGMVAKTMQGVQHVGERGNEILDKITGGPLGKAVRYGTAAKLQAPLDAAQYGPKAAQYMAQKASGGIDNFLLKSPKLQALARTNPPAFKAIVQSLSQRVSTKAPSNVAGPGQQPVDEEQAKTSFVEGN